MIPINREGYIQMTRLVALITDCLTITIHAGKCYKAVTDSGAAISLIRYSTYQLIDDSFKTPIQLPSTKLNTADGSPMTALGMTALHHRIADFKFTHNFIILFIILLTTGHWNNIWNWYRNFPYDMPGIRKRIATFKRMADFSHTLETVNRGQQ